MFGLGYENTKCSASAKCYADKIYSTGSFSAQTLRDLVSKPTSHVTAGKSLSPSVCQQDLVQQLAEIALTRSEKQYNCIIIMFCQN